MFPLLCPLSLQSLVRRLDYEDHNLPAVLISLAQVARLQPRIFDSKQKSVVKDFVVKKLMLMDRVGVVSACRVRQFAFQLFVPHFPCRQRMNLWLVVQNGLLTMKYLTRQK